MNMQEFMYLDDKINDVKLYDENDSYLGHYKIKSAVDKNTNRSKGIEAIHAPDDLMLKNIINMFKLNNTLYFLSSDNKIYKYYNGTFVFVKNLSITLADVHRPIISDNYKAFMITSGSKIYSFDGDTFTLIGNSPFTMYSKCFDWYVEPDKSNGSIYVIDTRGLKLYTVNKTSGTSSLTATYTSIIDISGEGYMNCGFRVRNSTFYFYRNLQYSSSYIYYTITKYEGSIYSSSVTMHTYRVSPEDGIANSSYPTSSRRFYNKILQIDSTDQNSIYHITGTINDTTFVLQNDRFSIFPDSMFDNNIVSRESSISSLQYLISTINIKNNYSVTNSYPTNGLKNIFAEIIGNDLYIQFEFYKPASYPRRKWVLYKIPNFVESQYLKPYTNPTNNTHIIDCVRGDTYKVNQQIGMADFITINNKLYVRGIKNNNSYDNGNDLNLVYDNIIHKRIHVQNGNTDDTPDLILNIPKSSGIIVMKKYILLISTTTESINDTKCISLKLYNKDISNNFATYQDDLSHTVKLYTGLSNVHTYVDFSSSSLSDDVTLHTMNYCEYDECLYMIVKYSISKSSMASYTFKMCKIPEYVLSTTKYINIEDYVIANTNNNFNTYGLLPIGNNIFYCRLGSTTQISYINNDSIYPAISSNTTADAKVFINSLVSTSSYNRNYYNKFHHYKGGVYITYITREIPYNLYLYYIGTDDNINNLKYFNSIKPIYTITLENLFNLIKNNTDISSSASFEYSQFSMLDSIIKDDKLFIILSFRYAVSSSSYYDAAIIYIDMPDISYSPETIETDNLTYLLERK